MISVREHNAKGATPRNPGVGPVLVPTPSSARASSSVPIDAKFRRQSTVQSKQPSERSSMKALCHPVAVRHKKTASEMNTRLHNICNVYSNLMPASPAFAYESAVPSPRDPSFGPLISSFQGGSSRPQPSHSAHPSRVPSNASMRPPSRVRPDGKKLTINLDLFAHKKIGHRESVAALQRRIVTKLRASSSALALQHPVVASSSSHMNDDLSSQAVLNVKSLAYSKCSSPSAGSGKKQTIVPVKLRLRGKAKQAGYLRAASDLSSTKSIVQSTGVTTPTASLSMKHGQYKNLISAAAAINSARLQLSPQHGEGPSGRLSKPHQPYEKSVKCIFHAQAINEIDSGHREVKQKEPTITFPTGEEGSPMRPAVSEMPQRARKKNKIERVRDDLVVWIQDCTVPLFVNGGVDKKKNKMQPDTTLNFYMVGRVLGKGAFGKVNLCLHKLSRRLIAMKSLHKQYLASEHNRAKFQNEIALLRILRHKNIIRLYETFSSDNLLLIVIELCGGGDLLSYVRKRKKLTEPVARVAFKQVFSSQTKL